MNWTTTTATMANWLEVKDFQNKKHLVNLTNVTRVFEHPTKANTTLINMVDEQSSIEVPCKIEEMITAITGVK